MLKYISFIAALLLICGGRVLADDLAIIMGADAKTDNVSSAELTKIFRGTKSRSADGKKFIVIMQDLGSPERAAALAGIYGMTEQEYATYFLQASFTGAVAAAPKTQTGSDGVKAYLARTPGAIGYVFAKDVDSTVKVIKIDGKAPGEDGYKLKGN